VAVAAGVHKDPGFLETAARTEVERFGMANTLAVVIALEVGRKYCVHVDREYLESSRRRVS
jgi:hypothetical protein